MKPRSMEEKISYLLFLMGFAGLRVYRCALHLCVPQGVPGAGLDSP